MRCAVLPPDGRRRRDSIPAHRAAGEIVRPRVCPMARNETGPELVLGAHVDQTDPIAEAEAREASVVQFFLGDPQGYKGPEVRYAGGAVGLRRDADAAGIGLYVQIGRAHV